MGALIRTERAYLPNRALSNVLEEVESRFDDLRSSQFLLKKYLETVVELDEDVKRFDHELKHVSQTFTAAISKLNVSAEENQFEDCLTAYGDALEGYDEEGKFVQFWKKLMKKQKVSFLSLHCYCNIKVKFITYKGVGILNDS